MPTGDPKDMTSGHSAGEGIDQLVAERTSKQVEDYINYLRGLNEETTKMWTRAMRFGGAILLIYLGVLGVGQWSELALTRNKIDATIAATQQQTTAALADAQQQTTAALADAQQQTTAALTDAQRNIIATLDPEKLQKEISKAIVDQVEALTQLEIRKIYNVIKYAPHETGYRDIQLMRAFADMYTAYPLETVDSETRPQFGDTLLRLANKHHRKAGLAFEKNVKFDDFAPSWFELGRLYHYYPEKHPDVFDLSAGTEPMPQEWKRARQYYLNAIASYASDVTPDGRVEAVYYVAQLSVRIHLDLIPIEVRKDAIEARRRAEQDVDALVQILKELEESDPDHLEWRKYHAVAKEVQVALLKALGDLNYEDIQLLADFVVLNKLMSF